jgi:DNA-binding transcriptional regulator/RsmH inhibitor MraZ
MPAEMDSQGRVLIPLVIREDAQISGDVMVIARNDHLEVWNNEALRKTIKDEPLTPEDFEELAALGVG